MERGVISKKAGQEKGVAASRWSHLLGRKKKQAVRERGEILYAESKTPKKGERSKAASRRPSRRSETLRKKRGRVERRKTLKQKTKNRSLADRRAMDKVRNGGGEIIQSDSNTIGRRGCTRGD